ncbi:MAG TPA: J domain-containing protein [Pirellulales bacterium]|nr:J domain-containing protein [Pirellulales bacterium]
MDEHHLPPELERWPADPYALLGVSWNVLPRDLKRAYTRLIRSYKPEQYPHHFRRLREAYEIVLRHGQYASRAAEIDEPAVPLIVRQDTPAEPPHKPEQVADRTARAGETLDDLWEMACSGLEASAYERMRARHEAHPGHPDLCCRLYWLLALNPQLDSTREPEDWLAAGIMASGLSGPLGELYRRELNANPSEATSDRCTRLLGAPATPGVLVALVEMRWRAAAMRGDANPLVVADLERLRARIEAEDYEVWIGLLLTAIEHLQWSDDAAMRQLAARLQAEIDAAIQVHRRISSALDRLELSVEIAEVWRTRRPHLPPQLVELVRESRLLEFAELRPRMETNLAELLTRPAQLLKALDNVAGQSSVAVIAIHEPLNWWRSMAGLSSDPRSPEQITELVRDFLQRSAFVEYEPLRPKLLEFCLHESLTTEQIDQSLTEIFLLGIAGLRNSFSRDLALRFVVDACRVFWA